jgi:hypothetical protein
MSADNGIYILKTKDQYRVICAMAIDNLWFSHIYENNKELVPTRIIEYFGKSRYTRNFDIASKIAFAMENKIKVLEYGISTISIDKTWDEIVKEAKEYAKLEIDAIRSREDDIRWDWDISNLEKIINGEYDTIKNVS